MRLCNSCGGQNEDTAKYCNNCGAPLPELTVEPPLTSSFPGSEPAPAPEQTYQQPAQSYQSYQSYQTPDYTYDPSKFEQPATYSALAITGFIITLVSIFCCGLTAPIGLIISFAGLFAAARKDKKGMGFAIAGTIISGLGTLFIILCLVVSWSAIQTAYKEAENGDYQEFLEILEQELEEMDSEYSSGSSGSSSRRASNTAHAWNDYEVSDDMDTITITYTDGIPDDFEICDATFGEICDALDDEFGRNFDEETFNRLVSMQFISPDEFERLDLTRSQMISTLSYLAILSCEMNNDNFMPDSAVYIERSNSYEYYGVLDPNNIGHAVLVFTDGTNQVYFEDAMCGDEICWAYDFGDPEVYMIGMDSDSLNEYPATGFLSAASQAADALDPVM